MDQITVLDRESRDSHRKVHESIHIKLRGVTLNCKDGYQLPDLYMPLLHEEATNYLTLYMPLLHEEAWGGYQVPDPLHAATA